MEVETEEIVVVVADLHQVAMEGPVLGWVVMVVEAEEEMEVAVGVAGVEVNLSDVLTTRT